MDSLRLDDGVDLAYVAVPSYFDGAAPLIEPIELLEHKRINYRHPSSMRLNRCKFERGSEVIEVDAPGWSSTTSTRCSMPPWRASALPA